MKGVGQSFLYDAADDEPCVHGERGEKPVMASHDVEALAQRCLVVARGGALLGVAGHRPPDVRQWQLHAVGLAHDAYAPVNVGRETVAQVVLGVLCNVGACIECLVAHEHAVAE